MATRDFSGKKVDRYLLSSLIGSGSAGSVYKAVDCSKKNSSHFAIKCVRQSKHWRQQLAEIKNHNAVTRCPNVMKLCDIFEGNGYLFLVLPLCETDMFRAIWRTKVYFGDEPLIKEAFIDVLDGISACHKKEIFHRDLKPENIMCDMSGRKIKISDFGLSTNRRICNDGHFGTLAYMSPECWDKAGVFYHADLVDIWALGVILFNMVTCLYPWEEAHPADREFRTFLSNKDHFLHKYPISKPLNVLLRQILHPTPLMRLSIAAIREAIVEMDTFYKQIHAPKASSPLAEVQAVLFEFDSQQTCVEPFEDDKNADKRVSLDLLDGVPLYSLV